MAFYNVPLSPILLINRAGHNQPATTYRHAARGPHNSFVRPFLIHSPERKAKNGSQKDATAIDF
jgi:hypothetical protein